jgi:excinuclease UvrABC nuclease subunit
METRAEEIFENSIPLDDKLLNLPTSAGLVFFVDSQNSPIALLTTANIRRTVKNKLAEKIEKTKRADLKSITAKIYYTICPCKFRLAVKHLNAVRKIFGQNYKDYITLVLPWFIQTDLNKKIPSFCVTRKPTPKEEILGPFPGQKAATVFLKTLEDAFRLCKRSDLVNNLTLAASCPYLQMDACVGVCGGKISPEEYQVIIKEAFEAGVNPAKTIEGFQAEMQTAAKELNFEKAAQLKKKIEKLSTLKNRAYKWTGDLKKLKIVHIDKSKRIKPFDTAQGRPEGSKKKVQTLRLRSGQAYAVFVMDFFNIIDLGDFALGNPDLICEAISKNLNNISNTSGKISDEIIERFSIVSYFLYRSKPSGLWVNISEGFDRHSLTGLFLNTPNITSF